MASLFESLKEIEGLIENLNEIPPDVFSEITDFMNEAEEIPDSEFQDLADLMPNGFARGQGADDSPSSPIRERMDRIRDKMIRKQKQDWQNGY
ncbi:MAG TPA: hypothetical protein ENI07_15785 [Desulfobacterales bacterium]|nr:hypothetical protein [Desulfobacterales bacterium]